MNDERLGKEIGAFYRETDVTPPDSQESAREVAARLRHTPQVQRRRWLRAWRLRTTHSPDADQTTEHQPTHVPATNGHAPTVIGRTQTMFSPVKAITAGALVFALGGVLLVAQPFDQQDSVPGAEQGAESAPPAYGVRITITDDVELEPEQCTTHEGGYETCTWASSSQFSATDLRLSGTATSRVIEYGTGDGLEAESIEVVNDEGTWVGTGVGVGSRQANLGVTTLTGEGAYDGFTALVIWDYDNYDDDDGTFITRGFIIEGDLPPFPEVPAE